MRAAWKQWLWKRAGGGFAGAAVGAELALRTTLGPIGPDEAGLILPHEHILTDLRGPSHPQYGQADLDDVSRVMRPLLEQAKTAGVGVLIECSSIGVGRNPTALERLSRETGLPIVFPTGVYGRGEFVPAEFEAMSEDALAAWMVGELENGVAGTPLRAGFIKIAADKEPLNEFQKRQLRAAARASIRTGAAIASHTPSGARAIEQADFLADSGARLNRFVWVHAQNEKDMAIHKALASRGVYIEYDAVGRKISDAEYIAMIELMIGSGFADRLLLSHDAGWYRPGEPNGGAQMPFTHLIESFLPAYKAAGASPESIEALTQNNPFSAFAMPK